MSAPQLGLREVRALRGLATMQGWADAGRVGGATWHMPGAATMARRLDVLVAAGYAERRQAVWAGSTIYQYRITDAGHAYLDVAAGAAAVRSEAT